MEPISDNEKYHFLSIKGNPNPITSEREITLGDDTALVFNNLETWETYIYSKKKRKFSIIEWIVLSRREWIPPYVLEITRQQSTFYLDLETDLCFSKFHKSPAHAVKYIHEWSNDLFAVHHDTESEDAVDTTASLSTGEPVISHYIYGLDKIYSLWEGRNIFSYLWEILDIFETSSSTYIKWSKFDALKKNNKSIEIVDIGTSEVVFTIPEDSKHQEFIIWWNDLVIISHTVNGIDVFFCKNWKEIVNCREVSERDYYSFQWKRHVSFQITHENWEKEYYFSHLNVGYQTGLHNLDEIEYQSSTNEDPVNVESEKEKPLAIPDNLSGLHINTTAQAADSIIGNKEKEANSWESNISYSDTLRIQGTIKRFTDALMTPWRKVWLNQTIHLLSEHIAFNSNITLHELETISFAVIKLNFHPKLVKFLEEKWIVAYRSRKYNWDLNSLILLEVQFLWEWRFYLKGLGMKFLSPHKSHWSDSRYYGMLASEGKSYLLKTWKEVFEFERYCEWETWNGFTINGIDFTWIEDNHNWFHLLNAVTWEIFEIWFKVILRSSREVWIFLRNIWEIDEDPNNKVILFLDDENDNYLIFDGKNFSNTQAVQDDMRDVWGWSPRAVKFLAH